MDGKAHWEAVYQTRRPDQVSWFQPEARLSLDRRRDQTRLLTSHRR